MTSGVDSEATGPVTSILSVETRPDASRQLARKFSELEIFEHARKSGGLRDARICRSLQRDDVFVVIANWDSVDDYQRWQASPLRAELAAKLAPLLRTELQGEMFTSADDG